MRSTSMAAARAPHCDSVSENPSRANYSRSWSPTYVRRNREELSNRARYQDPNLPLHRYHPKGRPLREQLVDGLIHAFARVGDVVEAASEGIILADRGVVDPES